MIPWFEFHTVFLGPIPLQVWGFWVALGIVTALLILKKRMKTLQVPFEPVLDLFILMIAFGFLGARLFHIVFYNPLEYIFDPWEIIKIWHGGLSSFGGFLGAGLGFWVFQKRKGLNFLRGISRIKFFDELVIAALYGWIIGRIGCVFIHDHLGVNSNCPLAFRKPDGARLDMAFLEILGLLPLVLFFFFLRKKELSSGVKTGIILAYYGGLRFVLDFFRARDIAVSDARYFGLTPGQYFAIVLFFSGCFFLQKSFLKKKKI